MKMQDFLINIHLGKKKNQDGNSSALNRARGPVQLLALVMGQEGSCRGSPESCLSESQLFLGSEAMLRPPGK